MAFGQAADGDFGTFSSRITLYAYLHFLCNGYQRTMEVTPSQIRAARGLLDISQQELADLSKVSLRTIVQIERGSKPPSASIVQALVLSLEAVGIEFISQNGGGPGVRLARPIDGE
ncbi:helix-turn-helix transcriptional regulator [Chelativorans salis]|uniref:Helix-turn-helix domain-containing protein n=1 Tax=Chelativorans salis TaxID=2978478 RepID=A0ABT2LJP1_9HYPH|nr:helix-turn-helix transcriptional regulator [Chelativorans sp. EGI FJ00035]MCT7374723.1 helix-turn-helix domain-containing protein [Chelativorans sp. EGI FJ00035]